MKASTCLQAAIGALFLSFSASALADNAVTARPANVLAGPDDSYPVVAQLDSDTPVQVMGCLDDWSWCDVAFQDSRGWMYAPDITYAYEGGYVPLYSYAPALGITVVAFSVDSYWGRYYHNRPWYSRREEFMRRGPAHHQRPPGPAPRHSPPPREVVMHRPDSRSGGARLSSAEAHHADADRRDADRHGASVDHRDAKAPPPRPEERAAPAHPEEHAPPAHTESHSRPAAGSTHEEKHGPAPHAAPSNHEEHPPSPQPHEDKKDRPQQ
ncbi:MAG TPA: SH3 domain-containing protein [Steroidobacteraceae bacterium]